MLPDYLIKYYIQFVEDNNLNKREAKILKAILEIAFILGEISGIKQAERICKK